MLDAGCHKGFLTALAGRLVGPTGRVVAYDADQGNLAVLRRIVNCNKLHNVQIENVALGNAEGTMSFVRPEGLWGCFRVGDGQDSPTLDQLITERGGRVIEVSLPVITLNAHCETHRISHVDLLKVDVDGPDLQVLQGAAGILKRDRPAVVVESSAFSREAGTSFEAMFEFLSQLGYSIYGTRRAESSIERF